MNESVSTREYFEAMLKEKSRALESSITQGDVALRDYIENQIGQIRASLAAQQRAEDKFESTVQRRFDQVNEFRGALDDLGKTMATRRELETAVNSLNDKVEAARIERAQQLNDARDSTNKKLDEVAKQVGELRSRIDVGPASLDKLQERVLMTTGQQTGRDDQRKGMYAALAATATVISIVIVLANVFTRHNSAQPIIVTPAPVTTTTTR